MKTLIKTIIILITINLIITGASFAQDSSSNATEQAAMTKAQAQAQAEAIRKDTEALKDQLKELQKISVPQPVPSQVNVSVPEIALPSFMNGTSSGDSVLVIPMTQMETEDVIAINEDMNVMSRIFEENLEKAGLAQANIKWFSTSYIGDPFSHWRYGNSNLQTMYLQGYGAIFMMNVDFPLSPPPPEPNQVEEQTDDSTDQVWEQTKKQLFEPQETRKRTSRTPKIEYDAEKVERLKATIIKSLRHAANIRAVQPNESVIVTITGSGEGTGSTTVTRTMVIKGNAMKTTSTSGSADIETAPPTKIVIRAKKTDIDAVAEGQIDMENFLGKVQILDCPYLSSNFSQISNREAEYQTTSLTSSSSRRGRSSGSNMYNQR